MDTERDRLKLLFFGHFFDLLPPINPKNQNFEKWKNLLEISWFYTCWPKITIRWCMVPEIWSEMDRIFCHFLPFFALLPPNNPENQNFEKMKNAPEKVTILHMYTKNHHHMIYASWDMKCDRQNVLSLRAISCPFTPLTTQKVKLWKNET